MRRGNLRRFSRVGRDRASDCAHLRSSARACYHLALVGRRHARDINALARKWAQMGASDRPKTAVWAFCAFWKCANYTDSLRLAWLLGLQGLCNDCRRAIMPIPQPCPEQCVRWGKNLGRGSHVRGLNWTFHCPNLQKSFLFRRSFKIFSLKNAYWSFLDAGNQAFLRVY